MQIAGALINGLLNSFQSIHALTGEEVHQLVAEYPLDHSAWYDYEVFQTIFTAVADKHGDISGLVFRAAIEFISGWYHFGGGKSLMDTSLDFIRLQADSQGYSLIVQAPTKEEGGWLELIKLDELSGTAQIRAYTPFPPNFTKGVFVGGLAILEDLDYVDVHCEEQTESPHPDLYHVLVNIEFVTAQKTINKNDFPKLEKHTSEQLRDNVKGLYWKYAGLQKQIEYEKIYRDQLNGILIKTTETVQSKNHELADLLQQLKQTQLQLIQQEKMASLGQLTAGIAHEVNNPVNFVANNAQALQQDLTELSPLLRQIEALDFTTKKHSSWEDLITLAKAIDLPELLTEMEQLIRSIQVGSERIQLIVRGLKTFSHQADDVYDFAHLKQMIDSTLTILSNKIKEKGLQIETSYASAGRLYCNASKLNQVLLNIIDNAIYATPVGGRITLDLIDNKQEVVLTIKDTGTGMDELTQQQIFDPFFTTKEPGVGTGLGLYLCYGIVYRDHNGHIDLTSKPGHGTAFTLYFPKDLSSKNN